MIQPEPPAQSDELVGRLHRFSSTPKSSRVDRVKNKGKPDPASCAFHQRTTADPTGLAARMLALSLALWPEQALASMAARPLVGALNLLEGAPRW